MYDLIGTSLGNYHLIERLGEGGMAQVYKAAQIGLARYVAIKVIRGQPLSDDDETLTDVERFEREAIAVAGLNHPNIVPVYDFGREGELYYMVMALIEGDTLKVELDRRKAQGRPLSLAEIGPIIQALAGALDYAHARGVIHRDLKPANVMLTPEGQVVLTDFGIARLLELPGYTSPGAVMGTPAYMSPEQVSGESGDQRSDIYALGVILYEMVTGRVPFIINQFQDMLKHVNETISPPSTLNPTLPNAIEPIILKTLHKNPDDRYQSAGKLAQALTKIVEAPSTTLEQGNSQQQPEFTTSVATNPPFPSDRLTRQDWGEAPDVTTFYGREAELAQLEQWVVADRCRLVGLLGLGGIGKTTLATRLAEEIKDQFEVVIWRSLRNTPPIDDILNECLQNCARSRHRDRPDDVSPKTSKLIEAFRQHRCLVVLDNFESILSEGEKTSFYQSYGEFLRRVGETRHQSCLILTSREKPETFSLLEGEAAPARSLVLDGLEYGSGRVLLADKHLQGTDETWHALNNRYSGNPLILKLVSETICDVFDGDVAKFLDEEDTIWGTIRDILNQQFERLSALEQDIIFWLAIEREPVARENLWDNLVDGASRRDFVAALQSLRRRSLVEKNVSGFTLQNVVMEYITGQLIARACHDIITQSISILQTHALLKAEAKDFIRDSQIRLILKPIVGKLSADLGAKKVEAQLVQILTTLRETQPSTPGYTAGNVLNLLVQSQSGLQGYDFSQLTIRQAHLANVVLHDVNFAETELSDVVFTETFGRVLSLAFSPDGQLLAAGTANGEIRLWQATTGRPVVIYREHTNWVQSVAFSPDGRFLASGSTDQTIRLWDVTERPGHCLRTWSCDSARIWSVAFSPDGRIMVSGGSDHNIYIWDVTSSSEKSNKTLSGHTNGVKSVAFDSTGRFLVSGSTDRTIRWWDIHAGQCLRTFKGHTGEVWSVALSPDSGFVASGSDDKTVCLWDIHTGQCLRTLSGHTKQVDSVSFSLDGQLLASGSIDQTVRVWDVKHDMTQCLYTLSDHTSWISAVAFSPTSHTLASGSFNQTIKLWRVTQNSGRCLRTWRGYANWIASVAFSPKSHLLASGGDDCITRIWDTESERCIYAFPGHKAWLSSVAFSPNDQILATGSADQTIRLWDVSDNRQQPLQILYGHSGWIWSVAISPDGNTLASGGEDQTVRLWDTTSGEIRHTLSGHTGRIRAVAFSPGNKLLASCSDDQTIHLWQVVNGQVVNVLQDHTDWVLDVAFSSDGKLMASAGADQTVRLWNITTAQCINILEGHVDRVRSVAFSPVSNILASGSEDKSIRLWDVNTGQVLNSLAGHTDIIKSVAFNSDGKLMASTGDDGVIKIWEVDTGICLKTLRSDRPYERMNIAGATGLSDAQKATLIELGAVG